MQNYWWVLLDLLAKCYFICCCSANQAFSHSKALWCISPPFCAEIVELLKLIDTLSPLGFFKVPSTLPAWFMVIPLDYHSNNSKIYEVHLVLFVYCQVENVILFLICYFIRHSPSPQLMSPFTCYVLWTVALFVLFVYSTCQRSIWFFFGGGGMLCCKTPSAPNVASVLWAVASTWSSRLENATFF